jgi:ADP-heptose:LPS heptosyltransferase
MDFQGYVHWLRPRYGEVHVITFPGREPLYRGCLVHHHDYDLRYAGYNYGRISHGEILRCVRDFAAAHGIVDYDMFSTMHLRSRWHRRILFRQAPEVIRPLKSVPPSGKIVFHFRNIDKRGFDRSRNFRPALAAEVCESCQKGGLKIACIGHPQYSLCPAGCEDRRTEDLEQTVAELSGCRLAAGELSGPLHLAAYCGRPIVIWAPGKERIAYALKRNPFGVGIFVVRDDTTNPPPAEIAGVVQNALASQLTGAPA